MTYLCYRLSSLPATDAEKALLDTAELDSLTSRGSNYLRSRACLKRELARRLNTTPETLSFTIGPHGKPELPQSPLHFNQSHSGELLCLAFHDAPIGVDIERHRPKAATERLASRIMCPQQLAAWQTRGAQAAEFFDCWCAAEALVKHAGLSIWHAGNFPFLWVAGHIRPLFDAAPTLQLFTPAPGYYGAIAYTPIPATE